jgi:hypothetical protein
MTSHFNRILNDDKIDCINTSLLICPLEQFKKSILQAGKQLTRLVDFHTDYRGAKRRSVKSRLEMEVKMRCLVAVHFIDLALLLARPATNLDFTAWQRIAEDIENAIKGLWFLAHLPATFPR